MHGRSAVLPCPAKEGEEDMRSNPTRRRALELGGAAASLLAASEWTRRSDRAAGLAGVASAYIPGILAAAAIVV